MVASLVSGYVYKPDGSTVVGDPSVNLNYVYVNQKKGLPFVNLAYSDLQDHRDSHGQPEEAYRSACVSRRGARPQ